MDETKNPHTHELNAHILFSLLAETKHRLDIRHYGVYFFILAQWKWASYPRPHYLNMSLIKEFLSNDMDLSGSSYTKIIGKLCECGFLEEYSPWSNIYQSATAVIKRFDDDDFDMSTYCASIINRLDQQVP